MNWLIYHFVSGGAFFTGSALVILGAVLGMLNKRWCRRCGSLACFTGVLLVVASATPLSYFFYAIAGVITLVWLFFTHTKERSLSVRRYRLLSILLIAICIVGVVVELPHHLMPTIEPAKSDTVVIFGDSVTAGIGEESETWPQILTREKRVVIQDHSRPGATVASVLKQASNTSVPDGIVILEIGGNDVLGSTPVAQFHRDLNALLEQLASPSRQIIMFELPLPPLSNSFGRVQRQLAKQYNVKLIPKRIFARVLTADNATLDSIHLSQDGHQQMADAVWEVVEPALRQETTD
jgi:acyl-CoA thioesterase-1